MSAPVKTARAPRVLLLLPTSTYRTQAFMEAARRLGVDVTVSSEEPSTMTAVNPTGLLTVDLADARRAADQVADFAARHPIAAVVPVDDQVAAVGAAISARLGLPSHAPESAAAARNKFRMRELLARAGVPQPEFKLLPLTAEPAETARQVVYPCVVKPLALAASQGVMRVNHESEFATAVTRLAAIVDSAGHSRAARASSENATSDELRVENYFLAEQFVPGPEVAVEGMLTHGRLRVLAIFDKPNPLDGPFFEETIYVTPSRMPAATQHEIGKVAGDACRALGLVHGPVHAELRLGAFSEHARRAGAIGNERSPTPVVIEINPRSIGGLCSRVLRFGTGLSLEEIIIRHALDAEWIPPDREGQAAGVMMIPIPRGGMLHEVRGLEKARAVPGVEDVSISAHVGERLVPLPDGALYLGFIFARGQSPETVETALRTAHAVLEFDIGS